MNRLICAFATLALCAPACATTTGSQVTRELTINLDATFSGDELDSLAQHFDGSQNDITIHFVPQSDGPHRSFNAPRQHKGDQRHYDMCLAPDTVSEHLETVAYLPMTCGTLKRDSFATDMEQLVSTQNSRRIDAQDLNPDRITELVHLSSRDDPVCFSVVPAWLADNLMFATDPVMAESYLIACAREIQTTKTHQTNRSQKGSSAVINNMAVSSSHIISDQNDHLLSEPRELAARLNAAAALLTSQPQFISRAFKDGIEQNRYAETGIFTQALEAHTEIYAQKWAQSLLTVMESLDHVNAPGIGWLADILSMMMYRSISEAPELVEELFEQIIPSLYPADMSFHRLTFRYTVLAKTCRLAGMLADVSPQLVENCLPGIDVAFRIMPEYVQADYVNLIERAVTNREHPYLTGGTIDWLRDRCSQGSCPWFAERRRAALHTPSIAPKTKEFFETFSYQGE